MLGKPRIYLFFPTRLINSIKHEHSCKILYLKNPEMAGLIFEFLKENYQCEISSSGTTVLC